MFSNLLLHHLDHLNLVLSIGQNFFFSLDDARVLVLQHFVGEVQLSLYFDKPLLLLLELHVHGFLISHHLVFLRVVSVELFKKAIFLLVHRLVQRVYILVQLHDIC